MPSGGESGPRYNQTQYFNGKEFIRTPESEANYFREWKEIIDLLYSHPSIVVWVPFNEGWGQFKTKEVAEWTKTYDPSRLVNPASGGNHYPVGDMLDLHNYPNPRLFLYDGSRATVLGEYGGIGLALKDHLWRNDSWGYVEFKTSDEATDRYVQFANELQALIKNGFSAAVYTQTTDVEGEVNGLLTYDRKVIKLNADRVRKINTEICNSLNK
jgi:beta-galactosidase/beta-glucuronidase